MASSLLRRKLVCLATKNVVSQPCRNGYIVLVPEVPKELPDKHSMSRPDEGFPSFQDLHGEQCVSTLGKHTLEYETGFWKVEEKLKASEEASFAEVVQPLEELSLPLDAAWGVLKVISLVDSQLVSPASYSSVHERARRARAKRFHCSAIYDNMKRLAGSKNLSEEEERTARKFVLEGRLNGLDLDGPDKRHFYEVLGQIGMERAKFKGKVEVATSAFKHVIGDSSLVRDFPRDLLKSMAHDKFQPDQGPWYVTLSPPVASTFMQYCPERELRWNLWQASVRRCSNDGETALNTSTEVEKLRSLRKDQAKLLGFDTFAHMSMQTKMAGSVETVQAMIATLLVRAQPAQETQIASLQKFAEERGFEGSLQIWDVPYWKRKQQKTLFDFNEAEIKAYFPLEHVLEGLFSLVESLFNVEVVQDSHASTWHPDVSLYHIRSAEGRLLGAFYLDPYARPGSKLDQGTGWMLGIRSKNMAAPDGGLPLAALVFNFHMPEGDVPCCLALPEMTQLFQKFGHMLQHVLASAHCSEVAGLTNVEWDSVNVSSELMAMWLQDPATLRTLSRHYQTGEPLQDKQVEDMANIKMHLAGHELCKELYLASLDLELHTSEDFWLEVVRRLHPQYSPFALDKRDAHPCSFAAIFSGDWAAAYYSNLWGRMVAADAFSAFQEMPHDLASVGLRFRQTMLETGGACQPGVAFRRFRGRDPSPNALLRSLGLKKTPPSSIHVEQLQ